MGQANQKMNFYEYQCSNTKDSRGVMILPQSAFERTRTGVLLRTKKETENNRVSNRLGSRLGAKSVLDWPHFGRLVLEMVLKKV